MAVPRSLILLGKAALVAALVTPPAALWLSGRFGRGADRQLLPAAPVPLATLPRSETAAVPGNRLPSGSDVAPSAAPPVTVGRGGVTVPPPVPGAAAVPSGRAGTVVGEPHGLPDPNKSEATPR